MCYHGDSNVLAKNRLTNKIEIIKIKDVYSDTHQVFDTNTRCFVDVKMNIVTGKVLKMYLLKKDCFSDNTPNNDFYITSNHKLIIDKKEIEAKNIPEAVKIDVNPQNVYSVCTEYSCSILINNLNIQSWDYHQMKQYVDSRKINWIDNTH